MRVNISAFPLLLLMVLLRVRDLVSPTILHSCAIFVALLGILLGSVPTIFGALLRDLLIAQ